MSLFTKPEVHKILHCH